MTARTEFAAPWGVMLKISSALVVAIMATVIALNVHRPPSWGPYLVVAILAGCILFTIRGYVIDGDALHVRRLFWNTSLDLRDLKSAEPDPDALAKSVRVCGNGGAFGFSGWYWNKKLGRYRVFATDHRRCVVLRFANRTVVVTPDRPEEFIQTLRDARKI